MGCVARGSGSFVARNGLGLGGGVMYPTWTEAERLREEVLAGDGDVVVAAVPVPGVVVLGGGFLGRGFLGGLAASGGG